MFILKSFDADNDSPIRHLGKLTNLDNNNNNKQVRILSLWFGIRIWDKQDGSKIVSITTSVMPLDTNYIRLSRQGIIITSVFLSCVGDEKLTVLDQYLGGSYMTEIWITDKIEEQKGYWSKSLRVEDDMCTKLSWRKFLKVDMREQINDLWVYEEEGKQT
ncbi:unnamed protein product [Cochlearia groenlandica]